MDKKIHDKYRRRRKILYKSLVVLLLSLLLLFGIRPSWLFKRPQFLYDDSWWIDFFGHFFIFLIVGFIQIYESRLVLQTSLRRARSMFFEGLGWGAGFEIVEFIFDTARPHWFSWLDSAQKGNIDTMLDLTANGGGILVALLLWFLWNKYIYGFLLPIDSRRDYLTERAELIEHSRNEARKLVREYRAELKRGLGKSDKMVK